jgi:hypothetical protein
MTWTRASLDRKCVRPTFQDASGLVSIHLRLHPSTPVLVAIAYNKTIPFAYTLSDIVRLHDLAISLTVVPRMLPS